MSAEVVEVLLRFGPAVVLLVAAGAIVAAIIGAANAWAVAWFNARATRQLAIDAAHREYRKEFCADLVRDVQRLDGLALQLREIAGDSLDAGVPFAPDDARRAVACVRSYRETDSGPEFRRPLPDDDLFVRAYKYAAASDRRIRGAAADIEAALVANAGDSEMSRLRRELAAGAAAAAQAAVEVQLAVECFVFGLTGAPRRRLRRLAAHRII